MTALHAGSRLVVPDDVVFRDVVGEAMILHLASGTYFGLDPIATRIWQLIVERRSLGDVCDGIADEFDAPADRIRADVFALAQQLVEKRLLDVE